MIHFSSKMEAHAATRIGVASSCADIPHTKNTGFDKKMKGATRSTIEENTYIYIYIYWGEGTGM